MSWAEVGRRDLEGIWNSQTGCLRYMGVIIASADLANRTAVIVQRTPEGLVEMLCGVLMEG